MATNGNGGTVSIPTCLRVAFNPHLLSPPFRLRLCGYARKVSALPQKSRTTAPPGMPILAHWRDAPIFPLPFGCAEEGGFPQHFGQPCGSFAFWGHGRQPSYRQKVMFPAFPSTPHMQPTQPPNPRGGGQRTTPVCQQPCGKPVRTCAHRCGRAFLIPNFLVPPPPPPPRSAISATTTPRPRTPHSQSRSDGPAA